MGVSDETSAIISDEVFGVMLAPREVSPSRIGTLDLTSMTPTASSTRCGGDGRLGVSALLAGDRLHQRRGMGRLWHFGTDLELSL